MDGFQGVRLAGPADEEEVYALLMLLYHENSLAKLKPEKVMAMIRKATRREGGFIGVIVGPDGIEATAGLLISQWWYTDDWHIEEMWNFVHPNHRRSNHAKNMILWSKWIADQMQLPLLMGILTKKQIAAKMRLIQRQMPQVGALFLHGSVPSDQFNQRRIDAPEERRLERV